MIEICATAGRTALAVSPEDAVYLDPEVFIDPSKHKVIIENPMAAAMSEALQRVSADLKAVQLAKSLGVQLPLPSTDHDEMTLAKAKARVVIGCQYVLEEVICSQKANASEVAAQGKDIMKTLKSKKIEVPKLYCDVLDKMVAANGA